LCGKYAIATETLKILIVGTPRTGNTWVKRCLSLIYDLPVVDFSLPEFWRPFDAHPYDQLGHRWIAHQHLPPFDSIVRWARDRNVILITTTRHPADTLVSLYHYARNFGARGEIERETLELLQMSDKQDKREANSTSSNGLQAYVREKFFKTLHFSIAWLQRRFSYGIRYESLWDKPFETIETLTNQISPVSCQHIRDCLEKCQLEQMRKDAQGDAAFFRGGGLGNWKTSLPAEIVEMLRHLSPYASQIEWLGYRLDDYPIASIPPTLTLRSPPARTALSFLGPTFMAAEETNCPEVYYRWLNSVSDKDPYHGRTRPAITNLGTYIYENRLDLQVAFPDPYGSDRVAFSHWFTEVNFVGVQKLDPFFLVPVYESWLTGPHPSFNPIHCPTQTA
jgi:hypothetical protein